METSNPPHLQQQDKEKLGKQQVLLSKWSNGSFVADGNVNSQSSLAVQRDLKMFKPYKHPLLSVHDREKHLHPYTRSPCNYVPSRMFLKAKLANPVNVLLKRKDKWITAYSHDELGGISENSIYITSTHINRDKSEQWLSKKGKLQKIGNILMEESKTSKPNNILHIWMHTHGKI